MSAAQQEGPAQQGCGAPAGGAAMPATASGEAVIEGHVTRGGAPLPVGYARLLNDGGFRFFAAPGTWTVRVLAPGGVNTDETVTADYGHRTAVEVSV